MRGSAVNALLRSDPERLRAGDHLPLKSAPVAFFKLVAAKWPECGRRACHVFLPALILRSKMPEAREQAKPRAAQGQGGTKGFVGALPFVVTDVWQNPLNP